MSEITSFELYKRIAEPLIQQFPHFHDRYLAAAWIRKLEDPTLAEESLRLAYLQLLIFNLQRDKLIGMFSDSPILYPQLVDFRAEFDVHEYAQCLAEREHKRAAKEVRNQINGVDQERRPMQIDYSEDLREYVAAQDVPNFGAHCYYAFSEEPLDKWRQKRIKVPFEMARSQHQESVLKCMCVGDAKQKECLKTKVEKNLFFPVPTPSPMWSYSSPDDGKDVPTWGSNVHALRKKRKPFSKCS